MLSCLRIENFVLIDQLELNFAAGLNVLTGETGAGKSIILDAIDIALGGRVNQRMIRQGSKKTIVEVIFQPNATIANWLQQQEIDLLEDDSLVVMRELAIANSTLRSRSRVNGVLVNRRHLSQLREILVEITAQGQTVQLMNTSVQRELLDLYGGETLGQQRQLVAIAYEESQIAEKALEKRRQSEQQRLQRLDLLTYQLQELAAAKLTDGDELEQLLQESDRLSHVVELQKLSYQAYQYLYQNDSETEAVTDLLANAESILTNMLHYDPELASILELIRSATTQVVEAGYQINGYGNSLEADPERLSEVEERIRLLKQICRKYGPSLSDAIAYYQKLQAELEELTDSNQSLEDLEQKYQTCQDKLSKLCKKLTKLRQLAGQELEKQLIAELKPLAMDKVIFQCQINPCPPHGLGSDSVAYYFSPNAGEKPQPLSEIASGGEMSRFLLALKACFSQTKLGAGTLIFDEIDAGVSGKVAQAIAMKLHQLSQKHQILCVTHQPLIAAMADAHFRVEKEVTNEAKTRTVVRVTALENYQVRRDELAQLTAGNSANEALTFAESILAQAAAQRRI